MKKPMKSKKKPAEPAGHPPVLDIKPDAPRSSGQPERHKQTGHKGEKDSR